MEEVWWGIREWYMEVQMSYDNIWKYIIHGYLTTICYTFKKGMAHSDPLLRDMNIYWEHMWRPFWNDPVSKEGWGRVPDNWNHEEPDW